MRIRNGNAEVGQIVSINVAATNQEIVPGHYIRTAAGRMYHVIRVHRVRSGKREGRYEMRARILAEIPTDVIIHDVVWKDIDTDRGPRRVLVARDAAA